MKQVTVSAPGKLMFMGEHAVVYGEPCIVTTVGDRLLVTAEIIAGEKLQVEAPQVKDTRFVDEAVKLFYAKKGMKNGVRLSTRSGFSGKYGFGSSSAVTVATLKALSLLFDVPTSDRDLFEMAYQVVLKVQQEGSGFDVAAAIYGGTLWFKRGGELIEPLENSTVRELPLTVGYTGVKSNSAELVKRVAALRERYPAKVDRTMRAIRALVTQTKPHLLRGNWQMVGSFMDQNQEHLRQLHVSSTTLERLINAAKSAGAYGAKLSGAGSGDCMIALVPSERREDIEIAITQAGGEVVRVATHTQGVRQET